jgi:hypothetical protein
VLEVVALVRYFEVQSSYLALGALSVAVEALSTGKLVLQPFEFLAGPLEEAGVFHPHPVGEGGYRLDPQVYPAR